MPDSNPHENRQLAMLDRVSAPPAAPMPSSPRAIHSGDVALAPVPKPVEAPGKFGERPPDFDDQRSQRASGDPIIALPKIPIVSAKAIGSSWSASPAVAPCGSVEDCRGDRCGDAV
jgi:hypothetical protein